MSIKSVSNLPKSLKDLNERQKKLVRLNEPRIKPLTEYVETIRKETSLGDKIPYFDPDDGGVDARCIFLLEAPGPKAVASGFISRDNPDESAKNFFELNIQAGIPREITISWNIVPWYIGTERKIRPANSQDIKDGLVHLQKLFLLLPRLELVVMVGRKAQRAETIFKTKMPNLKLLSMYHPSPMFINRAPGNRELVLASLQEVSRILSSAS